MEGTLRRLRSRKEILRRLRDIDDRKNHVVVVHYSCESFYDRPDGSTPRVTSIAVRNLGSGQTESFSISQGRGAKENCPGSNSQPLRPTGEGNVGRVWWVFTGEQPLHMGALEHERHQLRISGNRTQAQGPRRPAPFEAARRTKV